MNIEQVLDLVLSKLGAIIFDIEQIREKVKQETYTIEVKNGKGEVIKLITI